MGTNLNSYNEIIDDVLDELDRAHTKFPAKQSSAHEGVSVLREEFEELWDEVKKQVRSPTLMRKEAVQVAAMAMRFILEVCDKK